MKLFIWEGHGISTGYHDDGTLVVLAETVEEAREAALASAPGWDDEEHQYTGADEGMERDAFGPTRWRDANKPGYIGDRDRRPRDAIKREPDRVIDLETPQVVVFNGGGYD